MQFSQANMGADRVSLVQNANGVEFTVDHSVQYLPDPQGLGRRTFEGWASVRGIDFQGENTPPEAFVGALHRYLKKNPVLLWHHNFSKPIGRILSARIDYRKGIYVVGEVFRSDNPAYAQWQNLGEFDANQIEDLRALADSVWEQLKAGIVRGLSWRGNALKVKRYSEEEDILYTENLQLENLMEISLTPTQVQPDSQVVGVNLTAKALNAPDCGATRGANSMSEFTLSPQEGLNALIQSLQSLEDGTQLPEEFMADLGQTVKSLGYDLAIPGEEVEEDEPVVQSDETAKALMALTTQLQRLQPGVKPEKADRQAAASQDEPSVAPPKPAQGKKVGFDGLCIKALENASNGDEEALTSMTPEDSIKLMGVRSMALSGEGGVHFSKEPFSRNPWPKVTLSEQCVSYLQKLAQ